MRTLTKITIVLLLTIYSASSWASCGPEAEFYTEYNKNNNDSYGHSGYDNYDNNWKDYDEDKYKFGFKIEFPLSTVECDRIKEQAIKEKHTAAEKKADAMEQRLRNFEKIVRICKIDKSLEVCSRLNQMSRELGLD